MLRYVEEYFDGEEQLRTACPGSPLSGNIPPHAGKNISDAPPIKAVECSAYSVMVALHLGSAIMIQYLAHLVEIATAEEVEVNHEVIKLEEFQALAKAGMKGEGFFISLVKAAVKAPEEL